MCKSQFSKNKKKRLKRSTIEQDVWRIKKHEETLLPLLLLFQKNWVSIVNEWSFEA